jgi:hypothetical protein
VFVEILEQAIAETRIFAKKTELKSKHRRSWKAAFREELQKGGWPQSKVDLIVRLSSPRLLAKNVAADEFRCTLDHVSRAINVAIPAE